MYFSSSVFIFIFLPVTIMVYFLLGHFGSSRRMQQQFLLLASVIFCGYINFWYGVIVVISAVVNFFCAFGMGGNAHGRKIWMALGVAFNVLLLGYFKYSNFFLESLNVCLGTDFILKNIFLPLGISFFTFQQLVFLLSVWKGEERADDFWEYLLFVLFFPRLVSGPIITYGEVMPQFREDKNSHFNAENMAKGIYIFVIGLFKKLVIADSLALFVDNGFGIEGIGFAAAWITSLSYTFQIYFDFSGYSDMAVGVGYMLNIHLPVNFNSPYKAAGIKDFWSRWHMTLSRALSKLVYIPLGGNRKGKIRTYINLVLTFLASGLWHGASWTFVAWGAVHGVLSAVDRLCKPILGKIPKAIKVCLTFMLVNVGWVLFRAESFQGALTVFKGMFWPEHLKLEQVNTVVYDGIFSYPLILNLLMALGILLVLFFIVFTRKNSNEMLAVFKPKAATLAWAVLLFLVSIVHLSRVSTFIYSGF